jgi:hypothetical protein
VRSLVIANTIGGVQDADYLELGRWIRPPQFDALPPEFRELGPSYRAGNAAGTQRWVELEKISRPPASGAAPVSAQPHDFCLARNHPAAHSPRDCAATNTAAFRGADQRLRDLYRPRSGLEGGFGLPFQSIGDYASKWTNFEQSARWSAASAVAYESLLEQA